MTTHRHGPPGGNGPQCEPVDWGMSQSRAKAGPKMTLGSPTKPNDLSLEVRVFPDPAGHNWITWPGVVCRFDFVLKCEMEQVLTILHLPAMFA